MGERSSHITHDGPGKGSPLLRESQPVLRVNDLHVEIVRHKRPPRQILRGVSLTVTQGGMHGLVGETGSGKSMTARAIMGLLPWGGRITRGEIKLGSLNMLDLPENAMRKVRGPVAGMIFQNPRAALHPLLTVEAQMRNIILAHRKSERKDVHNRVREYLKLAGISDVNRIASAYPHELSGGLAQRVIIATVFVLEPIFVIADEPTTGLDATVQRQILDEIADLQARLHLSVLLITHDLAIVAQYCDDVAVMHDGVIVEQGTKRQVLLEPRVSYTRQLIQASRLDDVGAGRAVT